MSEAVLIKNIEVKMIIEARDNPNVMPGHEFKMLVEAMREKGQLQPILVRPMAESALGASGAYRVIDGHHRLRAARELGMEVVPCVVKETDDAGEVILRIAMNKLRGELDLTGVGRALKELAEAGWETEDLKVTGFTGGEIADLMAAVSQNVDEAMPREMEAPASDYEVEDADPGTKLFELKVQFDSRQDLKKVKSALRRAGGKTKDMALGLLRLLGEEKEKT